MDGLPLAALSSLAHAFTDLSTASLTPPAATSLPTTPPSSTAHVAARLSNLIRHAPYPTSPSPPSNPTPLSFPTDIYSPATAFVLAQELAVVRAHAIWARSFLSSATLSALHDRLEADVCDHVVRHLLRPHLRPLGGGQPLPNPHVHTWPSAFDARRAVFLAALRRRYGDLGNAPKAAMIAGAPYVLFVYHDLPARLRIASLPRAVATKGGAAAEGGKDGDIWKGWAEVGQGVAVMEAVGVAGEDGVRGALATALKGAVKNGLAPVLVVVEGSGDSSLCAAADVMRAVCDAYGVGLHVEGGALSVLIGGEMTRELVYDAGGFVRCAQTGLLQVGDWFGRFGLADVTWGVGRGEGGRELGGAMGLWFLLERVHFPRCAVIVKSLCEESFTLADGLYSVPHLIECKTVGCGANVLVSYAAVDTDAETRAAVNRAMLAYSRVQSEVGGSLLRMATFENREWLLFSPTRALGEGMPSAPCDREVVAVLCRNLICAARRCEFVMRGRAAFMTQLRQCQDVEVTALAALQDGGEAWPLYYAGVRVTPFGEVAKNGHWVRDEEMVTKVEKFTFALASVVDSRRPHELEGVLQEMGESGEVPVLLVGPKLPNLSPTVEPDAEGTNEAVGMENALLAATSAVLAEQWDYDESAAQERALNAADVLTDLVQMALNAKDTAAVSVDNIEATTNGDALLAREADEVNESGQQNGHAGNGCIDGSAESGDDETASKALEAGAATFAKDGAERKGNEESMTDELDGPDSMELEATSSRETAPEQGSVAVVEPSNGRRKAKKVAPTGFWGRLFGDDDNEVEDGVSSSGSAGSENVLEDDYFRP